MSVDLRGFEYAAEPVLQRRQWQLDATVAELGKALERLSGLKSRQAELRQELQAQVEASSAPMLVRLDPGAHSRALLWLATLQGRIAKVEHELRLAQAQRDEVAQRLRALQGQVEALETHRADARTEFGAQVAAQAATEADRDWLARRHARDAIGTTS